MPICSNCGRESDGEFAFCPYCAAPLTAHEPSREQRKTVTVLFCDVTGSTVFGESTDAEAVRALLARYFERMKAILEFHGGTVEKFIGDAVMAVFGVPQGARGRRAARLPSGSGDAGRPARARPAGADRRQHRRGRDRNRGAARDRGRGERRRPPGAGRRSPAKS